MLETRILYSTVFLGALILCVSTAPVLALDCAGQVTAATAACITERGLGEARACRSNAEARGCTGASSSNPLRDPVCQAKNKTNIDWIFVDSGASATFARFRSSGLSPFDAAVEAQAHNPPVQQSMRLCRAWVAAYLSANHGLPADGVGQKPLGPADCRCISVLPGGNNLFNVSNSCPVLDVSVRFVDQMNTTRSSWISAGRLDNGQSRQVFAPNYELVSISATRMSNSVSSFTCAFN